MLTLPTDTADALDGVSTSYDALADGVENCTRNAVEGLGIEIPFSDVLDEIFDQLSTTSDVVGSLVDDVQDEVDDLNEDVLNQLVDDVSHRGSYHIPPREQREANQRQSGRSLREFWLKLYYPCSSPPPLDLLSDLPTR